MERKLNLTLRLIRGLSIIIIMCFFITLASCAVSNSYSDTDITNSKVDPTPLPDDSSDPIIDFTEKEPVIGDFDPSGKATSSTEYSDKLDGDGSFDDYPKNDVQISSGQLTAIQLDDFSEYATFIDYCSEYNSLQETGVYYSYFNSYYNTGKLYPLQLVKVTIKAENTPVNAVKIVAKLNDQIIYQAESNAKGIAYLYLPNHDTTVGETYSLYIGEGTNQKIVNITEDQVDETNRYIDVTVEYEGKTQKKDKIDLMFMIDTTGSMTDELKYLQAEISSVIASLDEKLPNTKISLALLFYRDLSDLYVTRPFDFTDDLETQYNNLNKQSAFGGGDWEEAVDLALQEAVSFSWSEDASTKLLFHVLDAPLHNTNKNMDVYMTALYKAAELGIRIIPVASSGIAYSTEYLLRSEALLTGGTYTALTNHSGIGNPHLDPTTEEKPTVEYLNDMMIRLIYEFHTGETLIKEPINEEQPVVKPEDLEKLFEDIFNILELDLTDVLSTLDLESIDPKELVFLKETLIVIKESLNTEENIDNVLNELDKLNDKDLKALIEALMVDKNIEHLEIEPTLPYIPIDPIDPIVEEE